MAGKPTKTERLDLRLTRDQKAMIEEAAAIEGSTAAGFTVAAVMERASDAIYRARTLTLPHRAWDEFVDTVSAGPRPSAELIEELLGEAPPDRRDDAP